MNLMHVFLPNQDSSLRLKKIYVKVCKDSLIYKENQNPKYRAIEWISRMIINNQSVSRTPALEVYIVIHPLTPKDIPEDKDLIDDKAT
jgi:hypothetical protein